LLVTLGTSLFGISSLSYYSAGKEFGTNSQNAKVIGPFINWSSMICSYFIEDHFDNQHFK